jgi:hypothetical protein
MAVQASQAVCVSVVKEKKNAAPPKLFDLTSLQREANRIFGYTAKQTLDLAQSLYEKRILTYPRADSSFLTDDIAALHDGLIETEARRIVGEMKQHHEPNSPNRTHFMVELSPAFMQLASTKDTDRLFSMLPYKTLSFSKIEGRHGTYALIDKGENRDREIRKPRPSIRAQLKADKTKAAPKKAAAKTKHHDLEV